MTETSKTGLQNRVWSSTMIDVCLANGIDHFFVAPGSRCTPLTVAVANSPQATVIQHFDERGLAFACAGYGRALDRCAAFICTSGTAVANALPAVVEAALEQIPMLLLTADRPPELRETGANQAIDQQHIFGRNVKWYFDLPCPTGAVAMRTLAATVQYAIDRASSGPVHLNCMFREPFDASDEASSVSFATPRQPAKPSFETRVKFAAEGGNTIVIAGRCRRSEAMAAKRAAERLACPFLADVTSGLRGLSYDLQLLRNDNPSPNTVLHVGGRVTSKRWWQFIERCAPRHYIHVSGHDTRVDPVQRVTQHVTGPIVPICDGLTLQQPSLRAFCDAWQRNSEESLQIADQLLDQCETSEPGVARALARGLPEAHALFLGNSLPIRDMDSFGRWSSGRYIPVGANRGASGIDGVIASAVGFAMALGSPTTVLVGDLSTLHDLNSLSMVSRSAVPVIVVVINNDGGGIFHFLPVAEQTEHFEQYFGTPHGLQFEHAAKMFGISYAKSSRVDQFADHYHGAIEGNQSALIEVLTDRRENLALHRRIAQTVRDASR